MKHNNVYEHYVVMFFIMIFAGLLSTMNVWADKLSDVRFSLNDLYMILLMTGWMFLFMGLYYRETWVFMFGAVFVIANLWAIRTQFMVTNAQYASGMIPHHSMAVLMSKQLLKNQPPTMKPFVQNIINTQEKEINYLKQHET